ADVAELVDLKFDPVKIVAAVAEERYEEFSNLKKSGGKFVAASEYENISAKFLANCGRDFIFLRTYGATEVFPPDDADMIIDNTATGKTLESHKLRAVAEILVSSTRFIANKNALKDKWKGEKIREMKMIFQAILDARERVILEMNVPAEGLEKIVKILPCMRSPTIAQLYGGNGYAVKVAVKRSEAREIIPALKKLGATDILEYEVRKVLA
ncbi:MAG: ATP phosphoribosyltransferase, partial [Deltaproteobacteria bacterium]|nr:ATP phosphoribosyltransferase [Deltaproteobacteria bacterium]